MKRTVHQLTQGAPDWLAHRASILNASEAPVVMGASKFTPRAQLLQQKATGIVPEVSAARQALFDRGHAVEPPTIALIEEDIGDDLAPVVASIEIDGLTLGASYDGLSLMEDTGAEVKLWNDDLAQQIRSGELAPHYYWQLEQQFIVTPSLERIIFATSDGTRERFVFMEYRPVPGRRESLIAGWKQFAADLAAYVPAEVVAPATAAPVEALPAVSVQMNGALAVVSNLDVFGTKLREFVAKIPKKPTTDQEFVDCDAAVKALKKAEEALDAAEANALGQVQSVEELTRTIGDLRTVARTARLATNTLVTARKQQIRTEEVQRGKDALAAHIAGLNQRIGKPYMPQMSVDFGAAISGKKTLDSVRNAVDTTLAQAKIHANELFADIIANLALLREIAAGYEFLFADAASLVLKSPDDCKALAQLRLATHRAQEERRLADERERIRAEEQAKLQREQEAREREAARQAATPAPTAAPALPPAAAPIASPSSPAANVVPLGTRAPAAPVTPPSLKLGEIGARLGFALPADFLKRLGFEPAGRDRSAILFHESQFPAICAALVAHVQNVAAEQRAA
jgi:predicted phage-related endonuclease